MLSSEAFWKFQKGENKKLIVAFSAATVPAGKFSFTNAFKKSNSNVLYLNCPENTWYLANIGNKRAEDYYTEIIDHISKENEIEEKIFFGGSMGAYGAFYYGCLHDADMIISTGIETELFHKNSNSERYFKKNIDRLIPDLNQKVIHSSFKKAYLIYGERCINDLFQSSLISDDCRIKKIPLKNHTHSIPPVLDHEFNLINSLDNGTIIDKIYQHIPLGDSHREDSQNLLLSLLRIKNDFENRKVSERNLKLSEISSCNTKSQSIKVLINNYLLASYALIDEENHFKDLLNKILNENSFIPETSSIIIKYISNYNLTLAYQIGLDLLKSHRPKLLDPNFSLLYEMGIVSYRLKDYKLSLELLSEFCMHRPNHQHAMKILSLSRENDN